MDAVFEFLTRISGGDSSTLMVSAFVFLSAAALAFGLMAVAQGALRREAARRGDLDRHGEVRDDDPRSLRYASKVAAQRLIDYTTKNYSAENAGETKELRRRLLQAGFLDQRAPAFFFLARAVAAVAFGVVAFLLAPVMLQPGEQHVLADGAGGRHLRLFRAERLSRAAASRGGRSSIARAFRISWTCWWCAPTRGSSMEAALDRVGRELADSYRSLSANIHMATLEMRAGRTLSETLDHLADRLGLEEARSFATLLQQSEKLGSSLTEALRVYSDDMRHKRLSRAEEKAYSLPAKLSVPLTLCVFPVVIIVIMLPVYVKLKIGAY